MGCHGQYHACSSCGGLLTFTAKLGWHHLHGDARTTPTGHRCPRASHYVPGCTP